MLLLATFQPIPENAQWVIVSLLGIALTLLLIWSLVRRRPPLDSELVKLSLAIKGLQDSFAELNAAMKAHAAQAAEITALQKQVRSLEEHREKDLQAQRTYTRESTRELFAKLDAQGQLTQEKLDAQGQLTQHRLDRINDSLNANFISVENRLGRVDGAIEQLTTRLNLIKI